VVELDSMVVGNKENQGVLIGKGHLAPVSQVVWARLQLPANHLTVACPMALHRDLGNKCSIFVETGIE